MFDTLKSKVVPILGGGALGSIAMAAPCFAAETPNMFVVTTDMASPLFTGITTSITNLLPLGLSVMAVMVGVGLIPRLVYKFL